MNVIIVPNLPEGKTLSDCSPGIYCAKDDPNVVYVVTTNDVMNISNGNGAGSCIPKSSTGTRKFVPFVGTITVS